MDEHEPVRRGDFELIERISLPRAIPAPQRRWAAQDWDRIRRGHVSLEMEDKWNAFVESDRLYLHRSWTGLGVYEAQFREIQGEWEIVEAVITDDENSYARGGDEFETLMLELLIDLVLLDRSDNEKWTRATELPGPVQRWVESRRQQPREK